ncbi:hypothetical protein LQZ21_12590 [Treponema sp. TIM-1]|uniref:hypothetical protein n=1 Tax=Treponema sp. TIM-1 TaxID=2898417 RepID=UPI00397EFB36
MGGNTKKTPVLFGRFSQWVVLAAAGFLLFGACVSIPFRQKTETFDTISREPPAGEDINGNFPETVYIKTRTQTFNTYHYYILKDGLIWYKGITPDSGPRDWTIFMETGLPHNFGDPYFYYPKYIVEIAADADELVALSDEGRFYRICQDWIFSRQTKKWLDKQGWPEMVGLYLDHRTARNQAWTVGKRNDQVKYYEDPFGNQHHNGTQEIVTTYVLLEDGQEICYADPGLPTDFSRNFVGPERGAFKAAAISASASTLFLINDAGEMYTRIVDFDITGGDPMFFKYTYVPYESNLSGTNYWSNLTPWGLPSEDWKPQPAIPLNGKAAVTRHITILQNGQGNAARELRVAGYNDQGETGYWSKPLEASDWTFVPVPLYFTPGAVLFGVADAEPGEAADAAAAADTNGAKTRGERGLSPDIPMRGKLWFGDTMEAEWEYEIPNFNILEGSCFLRISWREETCTLILHPIEVWTYLRRYYQPGRVGPPKLFFVTLEIPENAMDGLSEEFQERLNRKFRDKNKVLFNYIMEADTNYITLRENAEWTLIFASDAQISAFPDNRHSWFFNRYDEIARYNSPELTLRERPVYTREQHAEIWRKIESNRKFKEELEHRVAEYRSLKRAVFNLGMVYSNLDLISRITLLNFVDIPKIYTITRFGKKIIAVNKTYTDLISDNRIWIDNKLIELLDIRIKTYTEAAGRLARGEPEFVFPAGFAETAAEYWRIAGLPFALAGTFGSGADEKPASLSPELLAEGFFGWVLKVGDTPLFSLLVEPEDAARTIFSRNGKTAREAPYRLKGILSVNSVNLEGEGRTYYNRTIGALIKDNGQLKVDIRFDGKELLVKHRRFFGRDFMVFKGSI